MAVALLADARRESLPDPDQLGDHDFVRIANLVSRQTGIRLPPSKRTMIETRLRKRMRACAKPTFDAYCSYLFDTGVLESELTHLIDVVTTNKTDFFREPEHFSFLANRAVPDLLARRHGERTPHLKLWSAASSNGAEAYTMAMVLAELASAKLRFLFSILGTDVSTRMLASARRAVYPAGFVSPVPEPLRRRYFMRSRDPEANEVRVVPELRQHMQFSAINLMAGTYRFDHDFDAIFLRNVLIYFEKDTQIEVARRLVSHLRPNGYLFLGHSETWVGNSLNARQVAPSIYQVS
ncbi:chemotaxis protein CheR [Rhodomicrobium vannielii ATCC 17100]|uniref:CheR family methyltransferase n=1 Tax=Rhodomicrobium vannielii TaxID=1069 RepID=UPI00191A6A37|nr:CheR family methyltransferase [Rhodomicrobium vannielii]MBJ7535762.1 chemotaxis protein CheR [Rhodomicrobium vannielii ATCC 17100]